MTDPIDYTITAITLWREARGESKESKQAIYWVIRNRMADPRWPSTAYGVCTQRKQFSCFNEKDPNATLWPTQKNAADWNAWDECLRVVDNPGADPTKGANHYLVSSLKKDWADPAKHTVKIGHHAFYKL